MKRCALCKGMSRIYCESDMANLCWDCDAKVHSANFLVARHSRSLLCNVCRFPVPWSASGARLSPTFSMCEKCYKMSCTTEEAADQNDVKNYDEIEEEVAENVVVPSSLTPPPPAPAASSSSSEELTRGDRRVVIKRMRKKF
ncbi:zinc finger protein CONSTANS-LIKE 5-like [Forsythia ovata]|uniref:Zinc finger protein CONSTANS-LIKE 5-like n=1 Tax=Forsythia ovata TaxID=205694 RepID=A0ABD1R457_9LAMI